MPAPAANHAFRPPVYTEVSLQQALDLLCKFRADEQVEIENNRHKASSFIFLITRTNPDKEMRKTNNTFYGQIDKISAYNAAVNWDYARALESRQKREQVDTTEGQRTLHRGFMLKVEDVDPAVAPMLQFCITCDDESNNINMYVQVFVNSGQKPLETWYEHRKNGQRLTDTEVAKAKSFMNDPDGQKGFASAVQRQGVEKPILPRTLLVQSLSEFKINGEYYVINDYTMPQITDEMRTAALKDVTVRREISEKKEAINKDAKKMCERLVKAGKSDPDAYLDSVNWQFNEQVRQGLLHPSHVGSKIRSAMERMRYWRKGEGELPATSSGGSEGPTDGPPAPTQPTPPNAPPSHEIGHYSPDSGKPSKTPPKDGRPKEGRPGPRQD